MTLQASVYATASCNNESYILGYTMKRQLWVTPATGLWPHFQWGYRGLANELPSVTVSFAFLPPPKLSLCFPLPLAPDITICSYFSGSS